MSGRSAGAVICGLAGVALSLEERDLLRAHPPMGVILFKRNCRDRAQVRRLLGQVREVVGDDDLPVLIDQEGGRVARLTEPVWRHVPAMRELGDAVREDAVAGLQRVRDTGRRLGRDLRELGITIDCAPVLDVATATTTGAIGDRAFGDEPDLVARCGLALAQGLLDEGVLPVIKHLPGHGRATVDSHLELPAVDATLAQLRSRDFVPFERANHLPFAMTAHVVFTAIDADRPATLSPTVIQSVVRERIGFRGLLLSDDLAMHALTGTADERALAALRAGCDIALYCAPDFEARARVLKAVPPLADAVAARLKNLVTACRPGRRLEDRPVVG